MAANRDLKDNDKADVVLEEYATGTKDGIAGVITERDGFGARKKVDPKEIKLVRKIDWYMMVRKLIHRANINKYADMDQAHPLAHVLLQLPRS